MGTREKRRVVSIVGVPFAQTSKKRAATPSVHTSPYIQPRALWWFDDKTLRCQQKQFVGAYMYQGLRTFNTYGECQKALWKHMKDTQQLPDEVVVPGVPPGERKLPEVKNIRAKVTFESAQLEWDVPRMKGLAYKVWLDGVAQGVAVTTPRKELTGLRHARRYKVEIRTQPSSRMDRRAASGKVTAYFTTLTAPKPDQIIVPGVPPGERKLPEVKNIRAKVTFESAQLEWDVPRMKGLAYKVWLDGVAQGVAVTTPRKELTGLRHARRYKVEIRTQPSSRMDRRAASGKVTAYFTTLTAPKPDQIIVPGVPPEERRLPEVKNIRAKVTFESAQLEWDAPRMRGLAYKVWLDGVAQGVAVTTPRKELKGLRHARRYKVEIRTQPSSRMDRRAASGKVTAYFTTLTAPKPEPIEVPGVPTQRLWWFDDKTLRCQQKQFVGAYMYQGLRTFNTYGECQKALWKHMKDTQQLPDEVVVPGVPPEERISEPPVTIPKPDVISVPGVPPEERISEPPVIIPEGEWYFNPGMFRCEKLTSGVPITKSTYRFTDRRECSVALWKYMKDARKERRSIAVGTAKGTKRKISVRAEKLMQEAAFPKAVKEAIEKGLEQKDAPRDIERIIEKVAKTNVPDYIILKTIAKRIGRRGIVQYKVKTDKGVIVYENADETNKNATLGMKTPTGEIIPLQIKVIR